MTNYSNISSHFGVKSEETLEQKHSRMRETILNNYQNIPEDMKAIPQWVIWRLEDKGEGKTSKVPYQATRGYRASCKKPEDWVDFETAINSLKKHRKVTGISFALAANDPFAFVDIDDLDKLSEGQKKADQLSLMVDICDAAPTTYVEVSASKRGAHMMFACDADCIPSGKMDGCLEVYTRNKFVSLTGDLVTGSTGDVAKAGGFIQSVFKALGGEFETNSQVIIRKDGDIYTGFTESDQMIIQTACGYANGEWFKDLFYGGAWEKYSHRYPSASEADINLIDAILFAANNLAAKGLIDEPDHMQLERIFAQCALGEATVDRKKGKDYIFRTICKVFRESRQEKRKRQNAPTRKNQVDALNGVLNEYRDNRHDAEWCSANKITEAMADKGLIPGKLLRARLNKLKCFLDHSQGRKAVNTLLREVEQEGSIRSFDFPQGMYGKYVRFYSYL